MSPFECIMLVIAIVVAVGLVVCVGEDDAPKIQETETTFWANKCHETFNEAQRAYGLQDWYSFTKLCDQHALYYRRYQMARDGHFERKTE